MKRFQVIRTHVSPYQSKDFLSQERDMVEKIAGLTYQTPVDLTDNDTILITNTHTQLKNLPRPLLHKTKLIIHPNSGYDHFSDEFDLWKNIPMVIGHSIRAQAVAEYSLAALFEGMVELPQHISWNKERTWDRKLLKGTSVWIFGHGHIGKIIADTLKILGMKVTVVDPYVENALKDWRQGNIGAAKVIIAATSLNPSSYKMFNREFFSRLAPDVLFINGARGKLVDEKSLKEYLLTHPEAFAFLDVFPEEPFGEEWHGFPQIWKTSHIAGVEQELDQKILSFEEEVLNDFLNTPEVVFFKKYEKELIQNKWIKGVLV